MTNGRDLVSLADRLAVLQGVRVVMALAALAMAPLLPSIAGASAGRLAPVLLGWLGVTTVVELLRRHLRLRATAVVSSMLLLDGVVVAVAVARTGGHESLLLFLVYLHLVAVTLLVSYRTGLKLAAWHAVLLFAGHTAAIAGLAGIDPTARDDGASAAALHAVGFLLVAVGTAAFSAVNERALRRGRAELHALVAVGAILGRTLTADEVALALVDHVRHGLGFRRAAVLTRRDGRWLGALDAGAGPVLLDSGMVAGSVMGRAWTASEPALVGDLDAEDDDLLAATLPAGRNLVVIPLVADGEPLGVLLAEWGGRRRSRIPSATVATLVESAAHAALSLRSASLLAQVRHLATRDALTGLWNRRAFEEALAREVDRARRTSEPVSLILLDVDHFKLVNDTHGHQVGDAVLREVGVALAHFTRASDFAARYGGEELAVVLPGCAPTEAFTVADRLRRDVGEAVTTVAVTLSAGVATLPHDAHGGDTLVRAADAALYGAKHSGRDRTVAATHDPLTPTLRRRTPLRAS